MKSEIDKYVTQAIRKRRKELGISQEALSYLIGRTGTCVANIENGTRKYNVTHLNLIAIALKCSIKDFFPDKPILPTHTTIQTK
ncbi:MAG: helix-turn-helix transcriptional regulator [Oscillibacter sp.]|nr:helix-turn-helix transcriptional regulator [Oscillibacter sp.]